MKEKKNSTGARDLKIVSFTVVAFIVMILFVAALGSRQNEPEQSQNSARPPEVSSASETEKPKTWQEVTTFTGSADKVSPVFELNGGETRMRYTIDGGDYAAISIYVMKDGESLDEDGGSADVSAARRSDETRLIKPAGKYYLDVSAVNNPDWAVTIEELR